MRYMILAMLTLASTAQAPEQEAIDGCIDQFRIIGGPDAANGGENGGGKVCHGSGGIILPRAA